MKRSVEKMKGWRGHVQTVWPFLKERVQGVEGPPARWWETEVPNEFGVPVVRAGMASPGRDRSRLVVLLHGMGGSPEAGYCAAAARVFAAMGIATLRLSLRGADGRGGDLHHAGFVDDLGPILSSDPWSQYDHVALMGFSLGGHVSLRAAAEGVNERIRAVVAVSSPLNLKAAQEWIDRPAGWVYREAILGTLRGIYPRLYAGVGGLVEGMPPVSRVQQARTIRAWDALTVVPRFGFADVEEYYRTQSVGPRLATQKVPSLVVVSPEDPMIPADSLRGPLGRASKAVEAWWVEGGGHVYLPEKPGGPWTEKIAHWVEAHLT